MKQFIKELKAYGLSNDEVYQRLVGEIGLFGVAFFGHKGKKGDKAKLAYRWNLVLSVS